MTPSLTGPLLAFAAILALIPLALWLLRRSPLAARLGAGFSGASGQAPVRLVAALALGPGQRIVTVEVGSGTERRWLVLGVGGAGISTLHAMAPLAEPPAAPASLAGALQSPFAQLLSRHRRGQEAGDAR